MAGFIGTAQGFHNFGRAHQQDAPISTNQTLIRNPAVLGRKPKKTKNAEGQLRRVEGQGHVQVLRHFVHQDPAATTASVRTHADERRAARLRTLRTKHRLNSAGTTETPLGPQLVSIFLFGLLSNLPKELGAPKKDTLIYVCG